MPLYCSICEQEPQKYKCAGCRNVSYCSTVCFKKHEVDCQPPKAKRPRSEPTVPPEPLDSADVVFPTFTVPSKGTQVSQEQLRAIADSTKIRGCLKSVELQQIIHEVDGAPNRLVALQKMISRNQDFSRFVGFIIDTLEENAPKES